MGGRAPGATPFPQPGPARIKAQLSAKALRNEAFTFLVEHLACEIQKAYIFETFGPAAGPNAPDPHGAYNYLQATCDIPDLVEMED